MARKKSIQLIAKVSLKPLGQQGVDVEVFQIRLYECCLDACWRKRMALVGSRPSHLSRVIDVDCAGEKEV